MMSRQIYLSVNPIIPSIVFKGSLRIQSCTRLQKKVSISELENLKFKMSKFSIMFLTTIFVLVLSISGGFCDDDDEQEIIKKDALGLTIPNPLGSTPFFETNNQNGRLVHLHIP